MRTTKFAGGVYHGVPLLGIPFIADQKYNGRKIQEAGIGLQLPYGKITKESLLNGINQILHNSSFRNNAKQLSKLSRDEQKSSIERTIWWAEYVLRHKGAKHLRSAALDLHWYQYLLLDVAAFLLISALFFRLFLRISVLLLMTCECEGAKILGISPLPFISHQLTFQSFMKALVARGHQVTVIRVVLTEVPLPNYTDVDISFVYKIHGPPNYITLEQSTAYDFTTRFHPIISKECDEQISSPQIQEFIKSNKSYDLVFLQTLLRQCYYGLVHHVGSPPVIGFVSMGYMWSLPDSIGTTSHPSYIPDILLPYTDHMTFFERLDNTLFWLFKRLRFTILSSFVRLCDGLYLNGSINYETERNMSLLMIETDWLFGYPAPLSPAVITFRGIQIKTTPDPLPEDLKKFLDEATDGVIYFSFGSNILSKNMPEDKIRIFIKVFSELPQKIVWKWDSDTLPEKSPNVKTGKWLPQQDILAHQNVRLFITHCGLQSFQEAVYHAVPLLGIPFVADQKYNARNIEQKGIGLQLSIRGITKQLLINTINKIIYNNSFKDNVKELSILARDEPQASLEKLIWWTEYVLRHKGAKHLRTAALDLHWYQYLLLDIAAFLIITILLAVFIVYYLCATTNANGRLRLE
ncbi:hypothetical protein L9F63_021227, partial [Diploptera punctata]